MLIPFPGNYHVPDSIDWCSSSCSSLVGPRTAKRRRTGWTIHARISGWFAESAGRLLSRLILVANVREKSILVPSVGSLGPAAESPPRTLRNAAASSFQELLEACFGTRRRRPRWLSPFKWLALTSWVPWKLSRHSLFKKV